MNDSTKLRPIDEITDEILAKKKLVEKSFWEIGRLLNEAKNQLEHGVWLKWLSEKVDFSERQAQRFMMLAEKFPNPTPVSDLGFTKLLTLAAIPSDEMASFLEETHEVGDKKKLVKEMTKRELEAVIRRQAFERSEPGKNKKNTDTDKAPDEPIVVNTPDTPVSIFKDGIAYLERHLNGMLEHLETNIDDPNDYNEALSLLRQQIDVALKKLPTEKPITHEKAA